MAVQMSYEAKVFAATRILALDFDLFIGELCENKRDDNSFKLPSLVESLDRRAILNQC
jgi:hypothetical protein